MTNSAPHAPAVITRPGRDAVVIEVGSHRERIRIAAAAAGYAIHETESTCDYYRRGRRYVRVSYGVRDQVLNGAAQTGASGGRMIHGAGKVEQVLAALTPPRR